MARYRYGKATNATGTNANETNATGTNATETNVNGTNSQNANGTNANGTNANGTNANGTNSQLTETNTNGTNLAEMNEQFNRSNDKRRGRPRPRQTEVQTERQTCPKRRFQQTDQEDPDHVHRETREMINEAREHVDELLANLEANFIVISEAKPGIKQDQSDQEDLHARILYREKLAMIVEARKQVDKLLASLEANFIVNSMYF